MAVPAVAPATINRRFVAYLLDGLLVAVVAFGASIVTLSLGPPADAIANVAISGSISLAYFAFTWTEFGCSPFQGLLGMRVLNAADGATLTSSQSVRRWAFLYGPGVLLAAVAQLPGATAVLLLSILYAYYLYRTASRDPQRRGFHDQQSGTIVLRSTI